MLIAFSVSDSARRSAVGDGSMGIASFTDPGLCVRGFGLWVCGSVFVSLADCNERFFTIHGPPLVGRRF